MFLRRIAVLASFALPLAVVGPALGGELHDVKATPAKTKVGTPGKGSVTLSAKNGWHLNAEAPVTLKIAATPGVTVAKPKLTRPDLALSTQDEARFDVALTATEPGSKEVTCEASFVICQDTACKPVKETVTLALEVEADKAAAKKPAKKK